MPIVPDAGDALFRTLLETAVDGIVVIDGGAAILAYNAACERLFGYRFDEVVGRNVKMLMPAPYRAEHDAYVEHYHRTREKRIIGIGREVFGQRKDGSKFPMYLSVGEGMLDGATIYVGIIHDLTRQQESVRRTKELQDELLHVTRLSAMGQMTAALAHELNQPLAAIANYITAARLTLAGEGGPHNLRALELIEKASKQTARAGQIIRQLREFVEKRESTRVEVNLNALIDNAFALAFAGQPDTGIVVRKHLDDSLPKLVVDKIQIEQVLLNLIRNSMEAMQSSTRRELAIKTSQANPEQVQFVLSDTGPGLPPEILNRLFQPFVTTKEKGMGIGLSICQTIVESHGGRIWASVNADGGASFHVNLPLKPGD
jgi:two-component system, LuxR family, sensor kinase FixL